MRRGGWANEGGQERAKTNEDKYACTPAKALLRQAQRRTVERTATLDNAPIEYSSRENSDSSSWCGRALITGPAVARRCKQPVSYLLPSGPAAGASLAPGQCPIATARGGTPSHESPPNQSQPRRPAVSTIEQQTSRTKVHQTAARESRQAPHVDICGVPYLTLLHGCLAHRKVIPWYTTACPSS
jgi:hypothetical protein